MILELSPVTNIDATGVHFLEEQLREYRKRDIQLVRGACSEGAGVPSAAMACAAWGLQVPTALAACRVQQRAHPASQDVWPPLPLHCAPVNTKHHTLFHQRPSPYVQVLSNPNSSVLRTLQRAGFLQHLGRQWVFVCVQVRRGGARGRRGAPASRAAARPCRLRPTQAGWSAWAASKGLCALGTHAHQHAR